MLLYRGTEMYELIEKLFPDDADALKARHACARYEVELFIALAKCGKVTEYNILHGYGSGLCQFSWPADFNFGAYRLKEVEEIHRTSSNHPHPYTTNAACIVDFVIMARTCYGLTLEELMSMSDRRYIDDEDLIIRWETRHDKDPSLIGYTEERIDELMSYITAHHLPSFLTYIHLDLAGRKRPTSVHRLLVEILLYVDHIDRLEGMRTVSTNTRKAILRNLKEGPIEGATKLFLHSVITELAVVGTSYAEEVKLHKTDCHVVLPVDKRKVIAYVLGKVDEYIND